MSENNLNKVHFKIQYHHVNQRVDRVLADVQEVGSRSQASKLIAAGLVLLNGQAVKASHKVQMGEIYEISVEAPVSEELVPWDYKLDIVHEDSDVIVVNKPAGMVVHPAYGHKQDTLVNALLSHTRSLSTGSKKDRPGLVHRIDKDTSGLLVVAKNDEAHRFLAKQFLHKTAHRVYHAVVFGGFKKPTGTIRSYLKRHPEDRKRVASVKNNDEENPDGKLAITHYTVLKQHVSGLVLLQLKLETGRTHQIRVHLSEAGHPIVGDATYGASKKNRSIKAKPLLEIINMMNRFALHATELGFQHPSTKEKLLFKVTWPNDLRPLVEYCKFLDN